MTPRRRGHPLPHPDSPEFPLEYRRLVETIVGRSATRGSEENTLGGPIRSYQASPEFKRLGERTQAEYRRLLSEIGMAHGDKGWKQLTRARVIRHSRDPLADTPRKADTVVSVLSAVFTWAVKREIATENPCRGIERLYVAGEGHRPWTMAEIRAFASGCDDEEWTIFALGLYTALRAKDLAALTWFAYDGDRLTVRTAKTRTPTVIRCHPVLKATLDQLPRAGGTILTRAGGRPCTQNALSKRFAKATQRLGIDATLHGLRTTHATLAAESGASDRQLMAALTHATVEMAGHYTRLAQNARLVEEVVGMLPTVERGTSAERESAKPPRKCQTATKEERKKPLHLGDLWPAGEDSNYRPPDS